MVAYLPNQSYINVTGITIVVASVAVVAVVADAIVVVVVVVVVVYKFVSNVHMLWQILKLSGNNREPTHTKMCSQV